jgi:hypothetical protein
LLVTITVGLAFVAVLVAIVVVAVGGGGELSAEHPDHPPLALPGRRSVGGTDAALLRLPLGLWGYHKQITDEALERFAQELTERDTRIAVLEQQLAEARQRLGDDARPRALAAGATFADRPAAREADRSEGDEWSTGHRPSAVRDDWPAARDEPPATVEEPLPPVGGEAHAAGPAGISEAPKTITDRAEDAGQDPATRRGDIE